MLESIRFNVVSHAHQIAAAAGTTYNPLGDNCISRVTPKGNLMGGILYQRYTGKDGSIYLHAAGFMPRWISRELAWVVADYPFVQLGVRKVFVQTRSDNLSALRLARHLGFTDEAIVRDACPDGDMLLLAMYRTDCRILQMTPRLLRNSQDG